MAAPTSGSMAGARPYTALHGELPSTEDDRAAREHAFRQDLVEGQIQSFVLELLDRPMDHS
eukprot:7917810-Alexandrium_andersonii.AAC.1